MCGGTKYFEKVSYEVFSECDIFFSCSVNVLYLNCKCVDDWDDILGHAMREKHYWILLSTSIYIIYICSYKTI
jgi:hypothetical protein